MCPSILPDGGGQAEVRVGGGPSGIVYGLQVPPQALVPAPGVGLSHAGGGKVRAGGRSGRAVCPSWGVPAGTAVLPARRSRPHHVFCVRFGLRFGLKVGTQKEGENSIHSLDSAYYFFFLPRAPSSSCKYCFRPGFVCRPFSQSEQVC